MRYVSTKGAAAPIGFSQCIETSLATDGGLYVPESFPTFGLSQLKGAIALPEVALRILSPFFSGDPLQSCLAEICEDAFNFPLVLRPLAAQPGTPSTSVLELFHGPTAAFKDFGARFLAACLARKPRNPAIPRRMILVATSGDTGGAVAAAFHERPGFEVVILFPKGKVSVRQERQLTAWGGNVTALAVAGDFDICQRLVKLALSDPKWRAARAPISANSINIGRLLPQSVYYAAASQLYFREKQHGPAGFIVPTGNLGNGVAALWAKMMGFPVGKICLATNANRAIPEYFKTGRWSPAPTIATLANAMDVGDPSNMERLLALFPSVAAMKTDVSSVSVSDAEIEEEIRVGGKMGEAWCPHTAVAARVRRTLPESDWVIVATAHASKFESIVEPLIGRKVEIPAPLAAILERPARAIEVEPRLDAVESALGIVK